MPSAQAAANQAAPQCRRQQAAFQPTSSLFIPVSHPASTGAHLRAPVPKQDFVAAARCHKRAVGAAGQQLEARHAVAAWHEGRGAGSTAFQRPIAAALEVLGGVQEHALSQPCSRPPATFPVCYSHPMWPRSPALLLCLTHHSTCWPLRVSQPRTVPSAPHECSRCGASGRSNLSSRSMPSCPTRSPTKESPPSLQQGRRAGRAMGWCQRQPCATSIMRGKSCNIHAGRQKQSKALATWHAGSATAQAPHPKLNSLMSLLLRAAATSELPGLCASSKT